MTTKPNNTGMTGGTWEAEFSLVRAADGTPIAQCYKTESMSEEEHYANARGIATLPELIRALEAFEDDLDNAWELRKAALAKARGEA